MSLRDATRWGLAIVFGLAGLLHLVNPAPFVGIVPDWVPRSDWVVAATGWAEIAGAAGLIQTKSATLRRAAGWGLALYALCVWPANFQHMTLDLATPGEGLGLAYHAPRLAAQPLVIWLALWASGALGALRWRRP